MQSSLGKPATRRHRSAILIICIAIPALAIAAVIIENDAADTVLGFLVGVLLVTGVAYFIAARLRYRRDSLRRDAIVLANLEPLRDSGAGKSADGGDRP